MAAQIIRDADLLIMWTVIDDMSETKVFSSPAMAGTIEIHKNDITKLKTDAVVNAANSGLRAGGGVCGAIFRAAGVDQLQAACDKIGHCPTGSAVITPAFGMTNNKYIIHAVGPVYSSGNSEEEKDLYSCYQESLKLAKQYSCRSIGFPLISSGIYGYPIKEAWEIALTSCKDFLKDHSDYNLNIVFVNRDDDVLHIGRSILGEMLTDSKILPSDRDDVYGIWLAQRHGDVEKRIRIYVSDAGKFRDSNNYQMVAEFKDSKVAGHYVDYMRGKKRYSDKDIILQEISAKKLPNGEEISFDKIVGVIASTVESLQVVEYVFT